MNTIERPTRARNRILSSTNRFWEAKDLGSRTSSAHHLLSELAEAGELKRVRRGLYWRGKQTVLGMSPPKPAAVVEKLAGSSGYGPAGLSASLLLGLSTQVPRVECYAVPARKPEGLLNIRIVSRAARSKRKEARLRPKEVALLETLADWDSLVEVSRSEAQARLRRMLAAGELDSTRLNQALESEPKKVQQRYRDLFVTI